MKKHLTLGIILTLVSASAYGWQRIDRENTTKLHTASDVYLASPWLEFEVQAALLILQPTSDSLHYSAEAQPLPINSPNWKINEISTGFHCGFEIGFRKNFYDAHTNLSANWEHFHSSDSSSKKVPSANMVGPFFEIGPDAAAYKKAHGTVSFHFDQVNLDYGLYVNLGSRVETNVYAGVGIAHIEQHLSSKFSNVAGTDVRTIKVPSTFLGAGPQLGFDFSYQVVSDFYFNGGAAASLFVGSQRNHTKFHSSSPLLASNHQKTSVHKKTQVVPAFEGKLGLSYLYTSCDYTVKVEAGYQAQVYINAIRSVDIGSEVVTPPVIPDIVGVFARTFEQNLSNFALAGPYLSVDFGF